MNELRRHGRELIDEARRERTPDDDARERVFAALMASVARARTVDPAEPVETKLLTGFAKWLVLAALTATVAGALYLASHAGSGAVPLGR